MGEARSKSRKREEILSREARCIYCLDAPETIEHMPPIVLFPRRLRLSGMEYASCRRCNFETCASDCAAGFLSKISPSNQIDRVELDEAQRLLISLVTLAPGFVNEIFDASRTQIGWAKGRDNLFGRKYHIK